MYFPKSRFKSLLNGHSNKKERKKKSHGNIFVGILIMPAAVRNICPGTGHNNCATNKTKRLFVNPKSFTFNGFYIYIYIYNGSDKRLLFIGWENANVIISYTMVFSDLELWYHQI